MKVETVTIQVPVELKDAILNFVSQLCTFTSDQKESYNEALVKEKDKKNISLSAYAVTSEAKRDKEEITKEETEKSFPPSKAEVEEYLRGRHSPVNPDRFYGWMTRNNWIDGRGEPITDWKKKVEEWEAREFQFKKPQKTYMPAVTEHKEIRDDPERVLRKLQKLQEKQNAANS